MFVFPPMDGQRWPISSTWWLQPKKILRSFQGKLPNQGTNCEEKYLKGGEKNYHGHNCDVVASWISWYIATVQEKATPKKIEKKVINFKSFSIVFWVTISIYLHIYIYISGWWFQPLWKIWVRQLGWWNSQYDGKVIKFHGSKPPISYILPLLTIINHYQPLLTMINQDYPIY